jgi:3-oxoadipate enol-lactonase
MVQRHVPSVDPDAMSERTGCRLFAHRRPDRRRSGHDVDVDLPSITSPTLACAGRHDDIAPMENSELLAARMPDARLLVFEGGHLFMIQDRAAFPAIIDFLRGEP